MKDWRDWTDKELADEAQTGLRGQGATVEMMRRLRDSLLEAQKETNALSIKMYYLTIAMYFFGGVQLVVTIVQLGELLYRH